MSITVSALNIYPVKSLAGIALTESPVEPAGLRHDRRWMVVHPDGRFMTQRTHPQMSLVETAIADDRLVLSTFGMDDHTVPPVDPSMQRIQTEVWGDPVNAVVLPDATGEWLSQALGTDCRLVCFPMDETRAVNPEHDSGSDHTFFADGYPLLIASQASLDRLNSKLASPVGMDRFRPNIVVSGCEPHAEDDWRNIRIGDLGVRVVEACARCSVPTVDPAAGVLAGPEPIHTLSTYRQRDGEIFFGMNAIPDTAGVLRVGDSVTL